MRRPVPRVSRLSVWHRIKSTHQIGKRVQATVVHHAGFGAICHLNPGSIPAILRKQEISWDSSETSISQIPPGSSFDAVVIGYQDEWRELMISRKAADPSPFSRFANRHAVGEIVEGEIVRLAPKVIVCRLEGALEGEIPWTEVPEIPRRPEDLTSDWKVVSGDYIRMTISRIDFDRGIVQLSILNAVQKEDQGADIWLKSELQNTVGSPHNATAETSHHPRLSMDTAQIRLRILIVEDYDDIIVPLGMLLRDRRHIVEEATSVATADNLLARGFIPDVIIVDLQLASISAEAFIRQFRSQHPDARVIVFSGNPGRLHRLVDVAELIEKPVDAEHLIAQIEGAPSRLLSQRIWRVDEAIGTLSQLNHERMNGLGMQTLAGLDEYFDAALEPFGMAKIALLSFSRPTNEVRCLRARDISPRLFDRHKNNLRFGFIGDVLAGNHSGQYRLDSNDGVNGVEADSVSQVMREINSDRVCGAPIPAESQFDAMGLFVFLSDGCRPVESHAFRRLQQTASALALAIDRSTWDAELVRHQRALSAGSLMLGMTHELRNSVTAMKCQATLISECLRNAHRPSHDQPNVQKCLEGFQRQLRLLHTSFESLLGLGRCRKSLEQPLDQLVRQTVEDCRPLAEQGCVYLDFQDRSGGKLSGTVVSTAFSQVIMNLVLNGIQHTRAWRKEKAYVRVSLDLSHDREGLQAELRVSDNGFGLEWESRERIFDMFYTTRRDGSGLGLYVAQLIAGSIGGRLQVESSFKFFGTTMLATLPLREHNVE